MKKLELVYFFLCCIFFSVSAQTSEATFYDTDKVQEIRINFQNENWEEQLDSLRIYGNGLLLGDVKINGQEYKNSGVRYRGVRSFVTGGKRNALHIKLNYIDKKQNHQRFKTLKLSNALRDPSMVREVLAYELAREYMPAPEANFAKIYINGNYYGLFVNVEDISNDFLDKHFGSHENSFFKATPPLDAPRPSSNCKNKIFASLEYETGVDCYIANYEIKSEAGWDDLIELTRVLNESPEDIEKVLNVDRTLWMLAFNNAIVNLSSYSGQYSQNYYLYKDDFGQFNPIIWDLNLAFGSFKNTGQGSDLNLKQLQELDPLLHANNVAKPLISKLLANEQYKKIYLSHLREIVFDNFVNDEFEKRAQELQRLISSPLFEDQNKQYPHNDFLASLTKTIGKRSKIPGLVELMSKRGKYLKKHQALSGIPPEVSDVQVTGRAKFSNETVDKFQIQAQVEKRAKKVKLFYRFDSRAPFKMAFMSDDGQNNDGKPGDKIFGVIIDPKGNHDKIEYYIQAENPVTVSFYPDDYMFTPMVSTLKELNQ